MTLVQTKFPRVLYVLRIVFYIVSQNRTNNNKQRVRFFLGSPFLSLLLRVLQQPGVVTDPISIAS